MNLTRTNWPNGWQPSQDPVNGDPGGLQRCDNLDFDSEGAIELCRGIQFLAGGFSNYIDKIYSKPGAGGADIIWVGEGLGSSIDRSLDGGTTFTNIGMGNDEVFFGDCFGEVLIFSGITRLKDNTTRILNLGLPTPKAPTVMGTSQSTLAITGIWTTLLGTQKAVGSESAYFEFDPTQLGGQIFGACSGPVNTVFIGSGESRNRDNDLISFEIVPDAPETITNIRIDFILGKTALSSPTSATDTYFCIFPGSDLVQGAQQTTTLTATRGTFKALSQTAPAQAGGSGRQGFARTGVDTTLDWKDVVGVLISIQGTSLINCNAGFVTFTGGIDGALNGAYNYIQVDINDNGLYVAQSPPSPASAVVNVINGSVTIQAAPPTDPQVTASRLYRISVVIDSNSSDNLNTYYQVGQVAPGGTFTDVQSDIEVLEVDETANLFLQTLQLNDPNTGVPDSILGVEGPFGTRMLYITAQYLYLSDTFNPDAIDSRYVQKLSGDPSEINLIIKKLTNNVLVLGTNKNNYELSGTLASLPDGTVDLTIVPLGEAYPPISRQCAATNGILFYPAADGIRTMTGSNSTLITQNLKLLWQGETRAGVGPVLVSPLRQFPMAVGRTRFYVSVQCADAITRLYIYDLIKGTWRMQYTDPSAIFATLSDRVLLGYNPAQAVNGLALALLDAKDTGGFYGTDGNENVGYNIFFQTVFDSNGQPRNRKDLFTLKLICDTGGSDIQVYIAKDGGSYTFLQTINCTGQTTNYIPLNTGDDTSSETLGFRYSIRIVDRLYVTKFKLWELTIEYDPRPEQVNYLRIQPSNLGTISRKRFLNYAFIIDTLGSNVTFTPYIDNSNSNILPANSIVNTPEKKTHLHYFTQEQLGTDINGILEGNVFEFYGVATEEIVSEKLPVPAEYFVIPNNDYGTPNRKRHSSYKFQINTRGALVRFTPIIDNVPQGPPLDFATPTKTTVEYFFNQQGVYGNDTVGIDIGGTLASLASTPFEFYGVVVPQQVEQLPPRLEYYRIPNNNFGSPTLKRVRTLSMSINTNGHNVTFNPMLDGIPAGASSTFNTQYKQTVYHYFQYDQLSFATEFSGELISTPGQPFEYYGDFAPVVVESLPVPRVLDQLGPVRFDKIGKMFGFRVRLIAQGNTLQDFAFPWALVDEDAAQLPSYSQNKIAGTFQIMSGVDNVYEVQLPKSVNGTVFRLVLGPTSLPFFRYDVQFRVSQSGMETDSQWIPVR